MILLHNVVHGAIGAEAMKERHVYLGRSLHDPLTQCRTWSDRGGSHEGEACVPGSKSP